MNFIHKLQQENAILVASLAELEAEIIRFRAHLAGPKFQGVDADGARRDWIATDDVDAFTMRLLSRI